MSTSQGYEVTSGWKGILADLGIRHQDVLRSAGLPEDLLERDSTRLPTEQFLAFAKALEEAVGDPAFPVRLAKAMSAEFFSPTIFASLCSPNLAVAATRMARFKPLVAPIRLDISNTAAGLQLTYCFLHNALAMPRSLIGTEPLFVTKLARIGTRQRICPIDVMLPVMPGAIAAHEAFLGCRIRRGDALVVTFSPENAQQPFLTASHAMWNIFEPQLRQRLADLEGSASFEARTHAVLLEALPSGQVSVDHVARRLAVSARTLQRRLREEGTSYKAVVRGTRERLARHYLSQTRLTVSEIAYLVGFDEPNSFFRAFHNWTGSTPETVRCALRN